MLECRYKGQCRIEYDTDFDVCYPCIGDWGDTCAEYEPMPDVASLLALADEMDHPIRQAVWNQTAGVRREHIMAEYASRIREALGVSER